MRSGRNCMRGGGVKRVSDGSMGDGSVGDGRLLAALTVKTFEARQ